MDLQLLGDLVLCAGILFGGAVFIWAAIQKPGD